MKPNRLTLHQQPRHGKTKHAIEQAIKATLENQTTILIHPDGTTQQIKTIPPKEQL